MPDSATVRDLESSLARLRGVRGVRAEVDEGGRLRITLLVVPERSDEETVNDVRTAAMAFAGLLIPESNIQILRAGRPDTGVVHQRRRKLSSLDTKRSGKHFQVRATLDLEGDVLVGEVDVAAGHGLEYQAVARAVAAGVEELLTTPVQVETVELIQLGDVRLAVVSIVREGPTLVGSALARADDLDAVARATLNALNRLMYDDVPAATH